MKNAHTNEHTNGTAGDKSGRPSAGTTLPALRNRDRSPLTVGCDARLVHELIGRENDIERAAEGWPGPSEGRTGDRADLLAIKTLRTLAMLCAARLGEGDEPVAALDVGRLALARGLSADTIIAIRRVIEGEPGR